MTEKANMNSTLQLRASKLRNNSIRTKLTVLIFSAVCLVTATLVSFIVYRDIESIRKNTKQEINTILRVVEQDILKIMVINSPEIAADAVSRLGAFHQIKSVQLYDKHSDILFSYNPHEEKFNIPENISKVSFLLKNNVFHIYRTVEHDFKNYGSVYFRVSAETLNERLVSYYHLIWLFGALLIGVAFAVSVFFQHVFTKPILYLANFVKTTTKNLDYGQRLHIRKNDELGELFNGINELLAKIEDTNESLNQEKERLHVTLESIADGVIVTNRDGLIEYMNPVAEHLVAWNEKDAIGLPLDSVYHVYHEQTGVKLMHKISESLQHDKQLNSDQLVLAARNGKKIAIRNSYAAILDGDGCFAGCVVVAHNVTESRELARKLSHQATHDALTDLANRNHFEQILMEMLQHFGDHDQGAVLYIDLDQFKIVNDTCGHVAGDALLKQVAMLLQSCTREADTIARLGGDEFGLILQNCPIHQAVRIAEKIRIRISDTPFPWYEKSFRIGVSIGLVPITNMFANFSEVMSAADVACYAAKDLGRNRIHLYHEQDQDFVKRHTEMHWVTRINKALEEQRFLLYFQRIVHLSDDSHHEVFEILLRLREDNQIFPPGAFLPAAERYNLMPAIDRWVIRRLFHHPLIRQLIRSQNHVQFNINLSGISISDPKLIHFLKHQLQSAAVDAKHFCLEITETSAITNLAAASDFIHACKELGFQFALDDFGSGVSSFGYLKNLQVDYLKIDGAFVRDMMNDPIDNAMVEAINHIGHVMGIKTMAEFVEDDLILSRLKEIGVDFAQGFYIHKPTPMTRHIKTSAAH